MATKTQTFAFASIQRNANIDKERGRMANVSLISIGEALGHEAYVDEDSLDTALGALNDMERLPAYITHRGAIFDDRLTREVGMFENFRVDGEQLKADFQAFESFMEDDARKFNRLFELAEKMPERFGLSIVFSGTRAWATPDGDVSASLSGDERPEGALFEYPSIRVIEVSSGDFVDSPAANQRGLFSKIDKTTHTKMTKQELSQAFEELETEKTQLSSKVTELEAKVETFDALSAEKDELNSELEATKDILSDKEEALATVEAEKQTIEGALSEKTEAFDALSTEKEQLTEALEAEKAKVARLKALIDGEEFRNNRQHGNGDDYVPSKEARDKRIAEYAKEHGIEEWQAVLQLSKKEPELWKVS